MKDAAPPSEVTMRPQCAHLCAKFCIVLEEAIRRETAAVEYYKSIAAECDFPEVQTYFQRFITERANVVASLHRKLDEIQAGRDATSRIRESLA